jgi:hypothetical protein
LVEVPFDEEHEFGDPYDFIDLMVGGHAEFPASSRDVSHMYFVQSESRCVIKKKVLTRETLEARASGTSRGDFYTTSA